MRHLSLILLAVLSVGCRDEHGREIPGSSSGAILDTHEYVNADGVCDSSETFGDPYSVFNYGCLQSAQVVRFTDGAAFITVNVGTTPSMSVGFSRFIGAGTLVYNAEFNIGEASAGVNFLYSVRSDLRPTRPTLVLDFDATGSYSDAASRAFTLTEVSL